VIKVKKSGPRNSMWSGGTVTRSAPQLEDRTATDQGTSENLVRVKQDWNAPELCSEAPQNCRLGPKFTKLVNFRPRNWRWQFCGAPQFWSCLTLTPSSLDSTCPNHLNPAMLPRGA